MHLSGADDARSGPELATERLGMVNDLLSGDPITFDDGGSGGGGEGGGLSHSGGSGERRRRRRHQLERPSRHDAEGLSQPG